MFSGTNWMDLKTSVAFLETTLKFLKTNGNITQKDIGNLF